MRACFAFIVIGLLLATPGRADQQCVSGSVNMAGTAWAQSLPFARFNPALGTLHSVTITVASNMAGSAGTESLDSSPVTATMELAAWVYLRWADNTLITFALPTVTFVDDLAAYDGTLDFAGTSGVTHFGASATASSTLVLTSPSDLQAFTHPSGAANPISLYVGAINVSSVLGTTVSQLLPSADEHVTICYGYTPVPPISFCAGDGSATACPCGNTSAPGAGEGCLNSTGVGARLDASGSMNVSNDTLVLTCSGLPGTATTLFFQGAFAALTGSAFGDGVRCIVGATTRLRIKVASGGVATYPEPLDAPISVTGAVPANTVRHYQVWYRNPAAFCTPATFNLSQALSVSWTP